MEKRRPIECSHCTEKLSVSFKTVSREHTLETTMCASCPHFTSLLAGTPESPTELSQLKKALAQAIATENYEEAARLRDQIRLLTQM